MRFAPHCCMTPEIDDLLQRLTPFAVTEGGYRLCLQALGDIVPLQIHEYPCAGSMPADSMSADSMSADSMSADKYADGKPPVSVYAADLLIPGEHSREILLAAPMPEQHVGGGLAEGHTRRCDAACLSGMVLTAVLARELLRKKTWYSYRVVLAPEGHGAGAYCQCNSAALRAIDCGFVITAVAGEGPWSFSLPADPRHHISRSVERSFTMFSVPLAQHEAAPGIASGRIYADGYGIHTASICKGAVDGSCQGMDADALSRTLLLYLAAIETLEDYAPLYNNM